MSRKRGVGYALVVVAAFSARAWAGGNWPQGRGAHGKGTSDGANLPTVWGPEENIVWRAELPSWSGSSPIVWGDRVFVMPPAAPPPPEQSDAAANRAAPPSPQPPQDRSGDNDGAQRSNRGDREGRGERRGRGWGGRGGFGRE